MQTNWNNRDIQLAWDKVASIAEEQMIYLNQNQREQLEKAIEKVNTHIISLK